MFIIILLCVIWCASANGRTCFLSLKRPDALRIKHWPPACLRGDPGKCAAGWEGAAAVVSLDSQQSVGRLPAAIKHRAREEDREKKKILNAHKNFWKPFRRHELFLLAGHLYSPSVPHPQPFIKTQLNIRRLLAVRVTSCDCISCELKFIKLLQQTDLNCDSCGSCLRPSNVQDDAGFYAISIEAARVTGHSCDVTKGPGISPKL